MPVGFSDSGSAALRSAPRDLRAIMVFKFLGHMLRVLTTPHQTYRRAMGDSVWHSSSRCQYWPTENFEEVSESPQFGVCPICVKIENRAGPFFKGDGWFR
jgi:hypothetical protein